MTAIINLETKTELELEYEELIYNLDFELLGYYEMIQDIYEELNYQGFNDEEIEQFTKNQYGTCLEILHLIGSNDYIAFFGTR